MKRPYLFATIVWMMASLALPVHGQDMDPAAPGAAGQPLDDRQPEPGKSIIRFPDHQIEVDGVARVVLLDRRAWLAMPPGGPALSVDPVNLRKQADGSVLYDVKALGKISVITAAVFKPPSVLPSRFREAIVPDETAVTANSGLLHKGDVLLSVPYTYKSTVRLTDDFVVHGLFGTQTLGLRGETGFDAGTFNNGASHQRLLCLFNPKRADGYAVPDCFAENPRGAAGFTLTRVGTDSNLPGHFTEANSPFGAVTPPAMETTGVTIDHSFHLELISGSWSEHSLGYAWRSEGHIVEAGIFPANADGAGYIHLGATWLKLSRTSGDGDALRVERVAPPAEAASAPAPIAPQAANPAAPKIVDGIVYTPAAPGH